MAPNIKSEEIEEMVLFCCMDCEKGFSHLWELSSHVMAVHSNKGKILHCLSCSGSFTSETFYNIHQTTNHFDKNAEYFKEDKEFIDQVRTTSKVILKEQSSASLDEEIQSPDQKLVLASEMITLNAEDVILKDFKAEKPSEEHSKSMGDSLLGIHMCSFCDKTFLKVSQLKRHEKTHSIQKQYQCNKCNKTFRKQGHLQKHIKSAHSIGQQSTDFKEAFSLKHYEKINTKKQDTHKCETCDKSFTQREHLKRHLANHTSENGAEKGPKESDDNLSLNNQEAFQCPSCAKTFRSANGLKRHEVTHTGEKPYQCDELDCNMAFGRPDHLLRHVRLTHTPPETIKLFNCSTCEKTFRDASNMRAHEKIHTGEWKSFQCRECDKTFDRPVRLREHMAKHNVDPKSGPCIEVGFQCPICDKTFGRPSRLNKHMTKHNKETDQIREHAVSCKLCQKNISSSHELYAHMTEHGDIPLSCLFCLKVFKHKRVLFNHQLAHIRTI